MLPRTVTPWHALISTAFSSSWWKPWSRSLLGLEVHGRRTGHTYRFPVQYAVDHDGLVVVPARAETKTWWTNLVRPGTPVEVLWERGWHPARAYLLRPGDAGYDDARASYQERWRRIVLPDDQVVVRIRDATVGNP